MPHGIINSFTIDEFSRHAVRYFTEVVDCIVDKTIGVIGHHVQVLHEVLP
jgi:hypothetical protein